MKLGEGIGIDQEQVEILNQQLKESKEDSEKITQEGQKFQEQVENLKQQLKESKEDSKKITQEGQKLQEQVENLNQQLKESKEYSEKITQEEQKLQAQVENLNQQINTEMGTPSKDVPTLSIKMDSFLDLNEPSIGWRFASPEASVLQKIVDKKMITLAVVGMYDVGKSWFCNEITGTKNFKSGYTQRTDGLNFFFPEEDGTLIAVIDTQGSNEAIRVTDPDLMQKITNANKDKKEEEAEINKVDDAYMTRYKILKNDAKMLQSVKEKFIGEIADVVVICLQ